MNCFIGFQELVNYLLIEKCCYLIIRYIQTVIKKFKNGKAPGYTKVNPEMIKYMGQEGTEVFLKLFNKILLRFRWAISKYVEYFQIVSADYSK